MWIVSQLDMGAGRPVADGLPDGGARAQAAATWVRAVHIDSKERGMTRRAAQRYDLRAAAGRPQAHAA